MMAPTEDSILGDFLLAPAPLPTVTSLNKFAELFPKNQRSHPQVKLLYRELQHLRATDIDIVRENITKELAKGESQRRAIYKAWKAGQKDVDGLSQTDLNMDVQMFGSTSNLPSAPPHTISTMLSGLEQACQDVERDLEDTKAEAQRALEEIRATVGGLSDLRYGKFNNQAGSNKTVVNEVTEGLRRLEEACHGHETGE